MLNCMNLMDEFDEMNGTMNTSVSYKIEDSDEQLLLLKKVVQLVLFGNKSVLYSISFPYL